MQFPILTFLCGIMLMSCSVSSNFPQKYYQENESTINALEKEYNAIYPRLPFAVAFTDVEFNHLRLELKRDSLRYIYEFDITDPAMRDSIKSFGYQLSPVLQMIEDMRRIKCTWINVMDQYIDSSRTLLVYMAIRPRELDVPFSPKKYFILTFYRQPQYYDEQGRLLDKRNLRRLRKVNNEQFWRINDRVCYTLSDTFR